MKNQYAKVILAKAILFPVISAVSFISGCGGISNEHTSVINTDKKPTEAQLGNSSSPDSASNSTPARPDLEYVLPANKPHVNQAHYHTINKEIDYHIDSPASVHTLPSEQQTISEDAVEVKHKIKAHVTTRIKQGKRYLQPEIMPYPVYTPHESHRENYAKIKDNGVVATVEQATSTFSIDVDTAAYSNLRRFLNQGQLPDKDAVRVEELINYFSYDYPYPENKQQPFQVFTEVAPSPWNKNSHLLHIGIQAYQLDKKSTKAANLVFLVDVSGSMQSQNKIGLLKPALKLLVNEMDENDRISIVSYAGHTSVVLKPTAGNDKMAIQRALDKLLAGGGTNGASGIKLAYQVAQQSFIKNGINRVVLATDGDFNLGMTDFDDLKQLVEEKRKTGVSLTTLGFGTGNYNDHLMEQLADVGNGNYSYIDKLSEARKVLVEEMSSTLNTVASDVKIQVEFNPAQVAEYRLIGYENRNLRREDFKNDKVDAGEIGENHTVTALYEVTLVDSAEKQMEESRYQTQTDTLQGPNIRNEIAFLRLRYKNTIGEASRLVEIPVSIHQVQTDNDSASDSFKFSAAVAAFGQQLRGGQYLKSYGYDDILLLARASKGKDATGYRAEFIQLVALAKALSENQSLASPSVPQQKQLQVQVHARAQTQALQH